MFQASAKRRHRSESKTVRSRARQQRSHVSRLRLESLEPRMMLSATVAGKWTALTNAVSQPNLGTMELLSNGSVMMTVNTAQAWEELTPSATGSYVNGTWSALASMSTLRLYDATQVLPNGNVMVLGGEYTSPPYTLTTTDTGEIYNPVTNTWTAMAPFPEPHFGAGPTVMLPGGDVLAGRDGANGLTFIYDPTTNIWSPGPTKIDNDSSNSETWTQLANGNIMSIDIYADADAGQTEILNPTTMTWSDAGTIPVGLLTAGDALGAATLLPNGEVFQLGGANSSTALYNPSSGTWAAGPTIPGGLETHQSTAAMMTNGDVLFSAGGTVDGPVHFFEYNPSNNTLTDVSPSFSLSASSQPFVTRMLALPSGQVLAVVPGGAAGELYLYTPVGSPQATWQPTISSVAPDVNGDGNYTLSGTQLNGLSAGASQGGSINEMASNYPIVELTSASGHVYFAQTFNWSTTGVVPGSTPETTQFSLPAGMPSGTYNLTVVANGIASSPVSMGFTVPTADLAVTDVGPASVAAGTNASYTITLTNNGPSAATNAFLSDVLPAGSTLVSMVQTSGTDVFTANQSEANVIETATSLIPAGSSDTFVLTVSAPINFYNGEVFSNSATVSTNAIDPVSANNTAAVTGSIVNTNQSSAFVVTNSGPSTGAEAGQATYTLTVTNNGPTDAPNVILTDVFGAHAIEVSTTQSQGPGYSLTIPNEVLFLFGTIPTGQTATATVTVELAGYGGLTNSASAYSSSDPNTTTNTAVVTTVVPEAPIVVSSPIKVTVTSKSLSVSKEVVATFTHANGVEPASNFVATINWGDNSTSTGTVTKSGTTYSVTGSHTYSKSGTYTVTTTVTDPGGDPPVGAAQNAAVLVATGNATTPAAATSSSAGTSSAASVSTGASANTAVSGGTNTVGSTAASSGLVGGAAGQLVADLDSLDALFELLDSDSDALQLG